MANPTATIITVASFVFLYVGKDHLNLYVRQRLPAPIPFELLLIIITTTVSAIFQLHDRGKITIAKEIPVGLPVPKMPRFDLIPYVFGDALEIAFVVVALHLSMCRLFNRRMGTKTNNNQELYAMGLMSTLSSVFTTYPVTSGKVICEFFDDLRIFSNWTYHVEYWMWSSNTVFFFLYRIISVDCDPVCWTTTFELTDVCVGSHYYLLNEECLPKNALGVNAFVACCAHRFCKFFV